MYANLVTVTDFLIKLGMKPHMHLVEISIFSLNNVTVRPTKIMNRLDNNWAGFKKLKYFYQSWSPSPLFFTGKKIGKI